MDIALKKMLKGRKTLLFKRRHLMATSKVQYCTQSRFAFMYHFILMNNRNYRCFDDSYFDALLDELNKTKQSLAKDVPVNRLKKEADFVYKSSLGYM